MAWREELKVTKMRISSLYLGSGLGTLVNRTAAQINLLVQGYAAGYKIARGTLQATASASVVTGLTTIVAAFVENYKANTATKANNAAVVTGNPGTATGALQIFRWKHSGASTPTLVAATTAGVCSWLAIGT